MSALLDVILPVFLLIGFGYGAARIGWFGAGMVDGVMKFAQNFAVPCLLFKSIAGLDLSTAFDPGLLVAFYAGAFVSFAIGMATSLLAFHRSIEESIAIGFCCLFSNSLLLGLPITERAYGSAALAGNYAIISMHAPLLYGFGITLMELVKSRGQGKSAGALTAQVLRAIFSQSLVIGIVAGLAMNLSGLSQPAAFAAAIDMMARSGIPAALFGLGGVLRRYALQDDLGPVALVCAASLLIHPMVTYLLARFGVHLDVAGLRSATITSAMPPGVNAYLFAHMYGRSQKVAAASVLAATTLSILTAWGWLHLLP